MVGVRPNHQSDNATTKQNNARSSEADLCQKGYIFKKRWAVVSKLGAGGFGQVYVAKDRLINNCLVAVKVESTSKGEDVPYSKLPKLPMELVILKYCQGYPHTVGLYGAGTQESIHFIVMQLVGPNLAKLRRLMKDPQRFTLGTSIRLSVQCLEAMRDLHSVGAIHRDVKPSNFAMGTSHTINKNKVYVLDFGLSRIQTDKAGNLLPERKEATFHGTLRYCSISAHLRKDLGRKDDLNSYFYMLIEFLKGCLPWRDLPNWRDILECKKQYSFKRLCSGYPEQLTHFAAHLNTLGYADRPNYDELLALLQSIIDQNGIDVNGFWDWENVNALQIT